MESEKVKDAGNEIAAEQLAEGAAAAPEVIGPPAAGFQLGDEVDGAQEEARIPPEPDRRNLGFVIAGGRNGVAEEGMAPEMPRWVVYGGLGAAVVAQAVISDPAIRFEEDDERSVYLFVIFLAALFGLWLVMIRVGWTGSAGRRPRMEN
ncbi:hypothetical protein AXF42_Ash009027 [Apostasia shenzhenica]|uniref:Uncharacterized protein n=1 Tax=Apostasia shenzhenica TaxID=1088818 RepID=A0A2I0ADA3_9ASPA|nr:hypothetical protein AXF42_Ash009027 [Apostasia shenzhenica]